MSGLIQGHGERGRGKATGAIARRTVCVVALGAVLGGAGTARAEFVLELQEAWATASYSWASGPGGNPTEGSQQDTIGPVEFNAFAEVQNLRGGGRAAAYQDLYGLNAVFAESQRALDDALIFQARAESNYEVRVSTPTRESGQAVFKFVINGGELRLDNFARIPPGGDNRARIKAEIGFFPGGVWRFDVTLGKVIDEPRIFDFNFDTFDIGYPAISPVADGDDIVVTIPHFEAETLIDREEFDPDGAFEGVTFSYSMVAEVELYGLSIGGLAGIGDPYSLSGGGPDTDAIQFFLDGQPLSSYALVPEPGMFAVLPCLGSVILARRGRRR